MKLLFWILLLLAPFKSNCQNTKFSVKDSFALVALQDRVKQQEATIADLRAATEKIEKDNKDDIKTAKDDNKFMLNLYSGIALGIAALIGFAINFFGRNAIKKRVEEIIRDTAQTYTENKILDTINSKLTNEIIENVIRSKSDEEITRILGNIESTGNMAIIEFKNKGDEILKSLVAAPVPSSNEGLSAEKIKLKQEADDYFNTAFNSKDPKIQISFYKKVIEIEPNNVIAINNCGAAYNQLKKTDEAIEMLTTAMKLDPKYYLPYTNRGNSYFLSGRFEEGLKDLDIAIDLNPKFYYPYAIKSGILRKQNKLEEAEKTLLEAAKQDTESPEAIYTLAYFYEETHKWEESLELYLKADELGFPHRAMLYNNMAVLFRRQKLFDKALQYIEKSRNEDSQFPNLDGTLALIYADKNDDDKFFFFLKVALEKGCPVWDYLADPGFDKYRGTKKLDSLILPYKEKYFA